MARRAPALTARVCVAGHVRRVPTRAEENHGDSDEVRFEVSDAQARAMQPDDTDAIDVTDVAELVEDDVEEVAPDASAASGELGR